MASPSSHEEEEASKEAAPNGGMAASKLRAAEASRVAFLPQTEGDDEVKGCRGCKRTPEEIEMQSISKELLPYSKCDCCLEPFYLKPDPNAQNDSGGGETVLAFDCDMFQRLRIFSLEASLLGAYWGETSALQYACLDGAPLNLIAAIAKQAPETAVLDDSADEVGRPIDCLLGSPFSRNIMAKIKTILQHNLDGAALSVGAAWEAVREDVEIAVKTFHMKKICAWPVRLLEP